MNGELPDGGSAVRCLSTVAVDRTFIYVDVADFSTHDEVEQVLIINSLVWMTGHSLLWPLDSEAQKARRRCEASLCIGDGYIFAFRGPEQAVYFASYLANLIEVLRARGRVPRFH